MQETVCEVLYRPDSAELKHLPEGPYPYGAGKLSWIGIQHGPDSTVGSLNVLDLANRSNTSFPLPGRPGFAFPTDREGTFVVGLERSLGLFDTANGEWTELVGGIDQKVEGTILNDGIAFAEGLVFGAKELTFTSKTAGLYLWRTHDRQLIQLRSDQICSNGKVMFRDGDGWTLYDIDSPSKTVVRYTLDVAAGTLSEPQVVIDLTAGSVFPDGMIATPDGKSVIIAMFNPDDAESGEAQQFSLSDGSVEAVWKVPGSPRVTCPQLVQFDGRVQLVLTTAVEGMPPEQLAKHPNAGCLFVAQTEFDALPETPVYAIG